MDWSSRDVEVFLSVCRTLNFTVSARALGLAQSAVSRAIADLERRLGLTLLVRNTRGMGLTPAGVQLARDLSDVARRLDDAGRRAQALSVGEGGQLRIALDANGFSDLVGTACGAFASRNAAVEMTITAMDTGLQREALQAGSIDVAFMLGGFGGAGLSSRALARLPVTVLWPDGWAPSEVRPLAWSELSGRPRIGGVDAVSATFERMLKVTADPFGGLEAARHRISHPADAVALAATGVGYAICCGRPAPMRQGLHERILRNPPSPVLFSVAWRRGDNEGLSARFVDCVVEMVETQPAEGTPAGNLMSR